MLLPLAQTFADSHPTLATTWGVIFDIAGVIGLLIIITAIVLFVLEIPALMKYIKKSSM
jgi:hypothetical protein